MRATQRAKDRLKESKVAMYAPFLYPWMLDLSYEISKRVKDIRYFTTGIYGNYPWKEYEQYAHTFRRYRLFSEIIGAFVIVVPYLPENTWCIKCPNN